MADFNWAIDWPLTTYKLEAYLYRGIEHANMGENDAAIADYEMAEALEPKLYLEEHQKSTFAQAFENRGLSSGNDDKAIEDYTKAIEINPNSASSFFHRGVAYSWKWEYDLVQHEPQKR